MKIDTEIRHVTKPGANLFLELGFSPAEARRLQAASRKQINDTKDLKEKLVTGLPGSSATTPSRTRPSGS